MVPVGGTATARPFGKLHRIEPENAPKDTDIATKFSRFA
ncbi:MAG: hypothetical protein HLUCCA12_14895 [Rhodobacteraceae bacterium HLUCCA12]|nr:MAG: hypothetical protein HLUCCA12_14895 [Rhodobacteraceae bacterium HLUCCA12]